MVVAYAHRGWALWFLGYPDSARHSYRKALSLAQEAGLPFALAGAHWHVAFVELLCGNATEAVHLADRGLALATEHGYPFWHSLTTAFRGWAQMDLGNPAAGAEDVHAALALFDSSGLKWMRPLLLALLAGGGLRLGSLGEGLSAVEEGLRLMQTTLDRFFEPELWRLKGELLLAQAKEKTRTARSTYRHAQAREAEQCFQSALKIARDRGTRSLELRAAMSLARLEEIAGVRGTAHDLLAAVYGWFSEGFDTRDLQEARTLLG
jgi:tetratricopeptide (TPR) repeat protein